MAIIEFPRQLEYLLKGSDLQAPIRAFADRVGEIVAGNKLPFFPDYTDHGAEHINRVLKSQVELLVPKEVWEQSRHDSSPRLLCDADAAVIIGATLLHDIAMHLHADGFLELIDPDSRFRPLPWFRDEQEGHAADRPWRELWEEYAREARRFSDRKLADIIGQDEVRRGWKFDKLPASTGAWETNLRLVIGEFLRRHHARLAHEIAIYGFPGLPAGSGEGQFPAMGKEPGHPLMRLADLIGIAARSHGISLRVCKAYIKSKHPGTPKPMGTAALYPMALLRVADYFQIDRQRAPAVLLRLKNPQSPISVREWNKHLAVLNIGPADDPSARMVEVAADIGLELYLQLKELLDGLQRELDHASAVLDEAYGTRADLGLNRLGLAVRRVLSNLHDPDFRDSLPYVPERTGYSADPNLLTLLVEPLYGKHPGVGVRELMQNAVDAVRELHAWCEAHGKEISSLGLPEQEADVLIDFIKRDDGSWFLRICDKGIGMTGNTLQNYFLRAGASFRQSADWAKEFLSEDGKPRVLRAGRFGVGAFAAFLLGDTFTLRTRHVSAPESMGYELKAAKDSQLIEIRRAEGLRIGTTMEVEISVESATILQLNAKYSRYTGPGHVTDWFCWDWPKVGRRVVRSSTLEVLEPEFSAALNGTGVVSEWSFIQPPKFDAVFWTYVQAPYLACNGLKIGNQYNADAKIGWPEEAQLSSPRIAVTDSGGHLPLTTQRYSLSQEAVPFINELVRDVTLSYIAHTLICGPASYDDALSDHARHPLSPNQVPDIAGSKEEQALTAGCLRWCVTSGGMAPADPWLYALLGKQSCLIYGAIIREEWSGSPCIPSLSPSTWKQSASLDHAALYWHLGFSKSYYDDWEDYIGRVAERSNDIFEEIVYHGIKALGHQVTACNIVVLAKHEFDLESRQGCYYFFSGNEDLTVEWKETSEALSPWQRFEARHGSLAKSIELEPLVGEIEYAAANDIREGNEPDMLFVAEVQTGHIQRQPETLLAKIWHECLGPQIIPFDPDARQALIEHGHKHPELRRHIEKWEEMKRSNSKWANYPHDERFRKNSPLE